MQIPDRFANVVSGDTAIADERIVSHLVDFMPSSGNHI